MTGYTLRVFAADSALPIATLSSDRASDVLDMIPAVLRRYPDCHRLRAYLNDALLFSVDAEGNVVRN